MAALEGPQRAPAAHLELVQYGAQEQLGLADFLAVHIGVPGGQLAEDIPAHADQAALVETPGSQVETLKHTMTIMRCNF